MNGARNRASSVSTGRIIALVSRGERSDGVSPLPRSAPGATPSPARRAHRNNHQARRDERTARTGKRKPNWAGGPRRLPGGWSFGRTPYSAGGRLTLGALARPEFAGGGQRRSRFIDPFVQITQNARRHAPDVTL